MDDKEKFALRVDAIRWYAEHGVPDGDEQGLRRLVVAVAGHRWLEQQVCKTHGTFGPGSPWELLRAGYFLEAAEILGVGARGGFKTKTLALLNALDCLTRGGIQIVNASATVPQAQRGNTFTQHYLTSPVVKATGLTEGGKFQKLLVKLPKMDTSVEILPATTEGLTGGAHVQRLRLDEYELLKPEVLNEAQFTPSSFAGHERGIVSITARRRRNGNVDKALYDRQFKSVKKILWCVAEVVEQCPAERHGEEVDIIEGVEDIADPSAPPLTLKAYTGCRSCPILPDCRGQFAKCGGWVPIDDLIQEFKRADADTWLGQKRARRMAEQAGRRVFPKFSEDRNVREMVPYAGEPLRVVVDFGGGTAPTAVLVYQVTGGTARVFMEYVQAGMDPEEDAENFEAVLDEMFPNHPVEKGVADSANPLAIRKWNEVLRRFQLDPVDKLPTKDDMMSNLRALVQPLTGGKEARYLVHPRCSTHIQQMEKYKERPQANTRQGPPSKKYPDRNDDTVDAASYLAIDVAGEDVGDQPGVYVVDTADKRVETSEPPLRFHKANELDWKIYAGAKLWKLLQKNRD